MNNEYMLTDKEVEGIYKSRYEAAQEDTKETNEDFLRYFDKRAKEDLGWRYYDYKDFIIAQELKSIIGDLENPDWDEFETPDNKAADLASMYRVLKYYLVCSDYKKFVKERRDGCH